MQLGRWLPLLFLILVIQASYPASAFAQESLVENQSARYSITSQIETDFVDGVDPELAATLESSIADSLANLGLEQIEWLQVTITETSAQEIWVKADVKPAGQAPIMGEPEKYSGPDGFIPLFISTQDAGTGKTILSGIGEDSDLFPALMAFNRTTDVNVGTTSVSAYEFSGNKKETADDGTITETRLVGHYESTTGILVDFTMTFSAGHPEIGTAGFTLAFSAIEMSIPTTLSMSIPAEAAEDSDLIVTGSVAPKTSQGQVALTYRNDIGSEQPVRNVVSVTDGSFSDTTRLAFGSYTVSAEYLGSGPFQSSTTDTRVLEVSVGEATALTYLAIGTVVFLGIIAGIIVGIYLLVKKMKKRNRQESGDSQAGSAPASDNILTRTYSKPPAQVFRAALEAAQDSGLSLKKADEQTLHIQLSKGMSGWSWGELLELDISGSDSQSTVHFKGRRKLATNITSDPSGHVLALALAIDKRLG